VDWLTFTSNLVDAVISWPVAIVVVAYMLREPLKGLLRALQNFETFRLGAGGVSLDVVSRDLKEVSQDVREFQEEVKQRQATEPAEQEALEEAWFFGRLSEHMNEVLAYNPRVAVDEAWDVLQEEIRALAIRNQEGQDRRWYPSDIWNLTRQLEAAGLLPSQIRASILSLQRVRNVIKHKATEPPPEEASSFVESALALANTLRRL